MQKEKELTHNNSPKKSTPIPVWEDYAHYHDFFIALLSFTQKTNVIKHSLPEFDYT